MTKKVPKANFFQRSQIFERFRRWLIDWNSISIEILNWTSWLKCIEACNFCHFCNFWSQNWPIFTKWKPKTYLFSIPVFGIEVNTGIPVLGFGIGSFIKYNKDLKQCYIQVVFELFGFLFTMICIWMKKKSILHIPNQ